MPRFLRWILRAAGVLVAVLLVAVVALWLVLQGEAGQRWAAARIGALASGPGTRIALDRVRFTLPDLVTVDGLQIADGKGPWLTLDHAEARLLLAPLLDGEIALRRLDAGRVAVARAPVAESNAKSSGSGSLPKLRLDAVAVAEVALAEPLLGEAMRLGIDGSGLRAEPGLLAGDLRIERQDGPGLVHASGRYDPGADTLAAAATIDEPSGRVLEQLAGRRLPLAAALTGSGPLSDWHGTFALDGGDALAARLAVSVGKDGAGRTIGVDGTIRGAALLPPELQPLVGPEARLDARAAIGQRIAVEHLRLAVAAGEAEGAFSLDPAGGDLGGTLTLRLPDLARFAGLSPLPPSGAATVDLILSGPRTKPRLAARLAADDLRIGTWGAKRLALAANVAAAGDPLDPATPLVLDLDGSAEGLAGDGVPAALAQRLELSGAGEVIRSGLGIRLDRLALVDAGARAEAAGKLADGRAEGTLRLAVPDLASLLGDGVAGAAGIAADVAADLGDGSATARIAGDVDGLALPQPQAAAALGNRITLAGLLRRAADGTLSASGVEAHAAALDLAGEGTLSADLATLAATLGAELPDLGRLAPGVAGAASLSVKLDGAPADPRIAAEARARRLVAGGTELRDVRIGVTAPGIAAKRARIDATATGPGALPLAAGVGVSLAAPGRLALSDLAVSAAAARLAGTLDVDLDRLLAAGRLDLKAPDLAPLGAVAGTKLAGAAEGTATLSAAKGQSVDLALDLRRLVAGGAGLGGAHLDARLADLRGTPSGTAKLVATDLAAGSAHLARTTLDLASAAPGAFRFNAGTSGTAAAPLTLAAAGEASLAAGRIGLVLQKLDGKYADAPLALRRPLRVTAAGGSLDLQDLALAIGGGTLAGSATTAGERIAAALRAEALPIGLGAKLAGYNEVTGRLGFDLSLAGTRSAPEGTLVVTADRLRLAAASRPDLPPLSGSARAVWRGDHVDLRGRVDAPRGAALGFSGAAPLRLAADMTPVLPPDGAVAFRVEGDGALEQIADLLPIGEDRIAGRYHVDAGLSGTVAAPRAEGSVTLAGGRYESLAAGTIVSGIELAASGDQRGFTLQRLAATDGGDGRISGSGAVRFGEGLPSVDLRIAVQHFRAVRRDDATATASGEIAVTGSVERPRAAGTITVEAADIAIPERLQQSVVRLDVERVDSRTGRVLTRAQKPSTEAAFVADLAIRVDAPGRIFVRGRGLDSEWRGRVDVTGTSAVPVATGTLQVVRGTYSLIGTDFQIARGIVTLSGASPPDPAIDLLAQASAGGIQAQVLLGGTVSAPSLKLSSDPPLPQDEVLSRVLFGTSVTQVTPAQGLQLAQAAASLAGGGGPDVLSKIRRGLGLDRLSIGSAKDAGIGGLAAPGSAAQTGAGASGSSQSTTTGNTTLSAGKYVAPGVYLGVEQGFGANQSAVKVETEITPHVTVDAKAGATGDNSVGLNFRMDY